MVKVPHELGHVKGIGGPDKGRFSDVVKSKALIEGCSKENERSMKTEV